MHFSVNRRFLGLAVLVICILGVVPVSSLQKRMTNADELKYEAENVTVSPFNHLTTDISQGLSSQNSTTLNATASANTGVTKRLKKHKVGKTKKKRRQHKGIISTAESSLLQSVRNQTETDSNIKKKRRRKLRRRKNRKNRRKQQTLDNTNILEVTTAKEMIFPTNTNSNSTINELIRKLNENPEDNFEDFRITHPSSTDVDKEKRKNVANLVAPLPVDVKFTTLHKNITLHLSMGNSTNHKIPPKRKNRCRKNKGGCAHLCNARGRIKCSCLEGFQLAADQRTCLDIDECKTDNGGCQKECHNTLGTYECRCPTGLRLVDDFKSCDDINECLLRNGHGPCQDTCENTFGSYRCNCNSLNGTVLGGNGRSCLDIDECASGNGGCSHGCINTLGRAFCSCPAGMELSSDWRTCQDINECEDDAVKTSCRNCINTEGSYHCIDSIDYQSDQPSKNVACRPLSLPPLGYISCSRDDAQKSYAKTGRERVMNSPGTICKLTCPVGFRLVGQFYVVCGSSGKWEGRTEAMCKRAKSPTLVCPPTQIFSASGKTNKVLVKFPPPKTDINWKYIKSNPIWAKDLNAALKTGSYNINFMVRDPNSKLSASCSFKIFVNN